MIERPTRSLWETALVALNANLIAAKSQRLVAKVCHVLSGSQD